MELGRGLRCYPDLFEGISEDIMLELFSSQEPKHEVVLAAIKAVHTTEDVQLRSQEERVLGFIENSVRRLSKEDLIKLLKFWTASNVWINLDLKVSFNSSENLNMIPTATTCSCTLHMSRKYTSQSDVEKDLRAVLKEDFSFDVI